MARIKEQSVREVVAATDMVEVVNGRTSLRRAGARWTGRCPFHEERTPSFSVNPVEKLYHCFGCGKGGDAITFVRETESLDFVEAVEWLAERFRVTLEYEETSPQVEASRQRRDRLHALLEQATAFYERHLWESTAGEPVRAYLAGRGLLEPVCRDFRLGLSPGDGLARKAQEKGFTRDELRAAGLTNASGRDYFPPRLMFPLADARGRIVGFQARKLNDDDPLKGKYVNTPETELFHKSAVLYGLHLARTAIAKQERAVVVEGNTDVIALRQVGFEPVIASMGTALTERQLKELQRLTRRVYLCFDADAAGEDATLRGMDLALSFGFEVYVLALEEGKDPADAPTELIEELENSVSYLRHRVELEIRRSVTRQEALDTCRALLLRFPDSADRQEAIRHVSDALKLPRGAEFRLAAVTRSEFAEPETPLMVAVDRLEADVLAACLIHPSLMPLLEQISAEHFDDQRHRTLRTALLAGDVDASVRAELDARSAQGGVDERVGKQLLLRLRERHLLRELTTADRDRHREVVRALEKLREAIEELQGERV